MLAEEARRAEEDHRVVEGSAVAFDDPHNEVDRVLERGGCDPVDVGSGHFDRTVEVAPELIATFLRPPPDHRSEIDALWVGRNERLREDGELRPALCRLGDQALELAYRLLAVEPDRSGLDDGCLQPHRANRTPRNAEEAERVLSIARAECYFRSISARTPNTMARAALSSSRSDSHPFAEEGSKRFASSEGSSIRCRIVPR